MRARNLKPGFFLNCELADAGPYIQLLFQGLWLMADKEGRLKDQPRVIKGEIFRYYDYDVNGGLTVLERLGHIRRYMALGIGVIEVVNFKKHQSPHHTEKASELPAFEFVSPCNSMGHEKNSEVTVSSPLLNGENPSDSLIPDSLIPDSLNHESEQPPAAQAVSAESKPRKRKAREAPPEFADLQRIYPKRSGDQAWEAALRACHARLAAGNTWDQILDGARRYAEFCKADGSLGTKYVKSAATFCGPDDHFLKPWHPPATKADARLSANISAAEEFMRRTETPQ